MFAFRPPYRPAFAGAGVVVAVGADAAAATDKVATTPVPIMKPAIVGAVIGTVAYAGSRLMESVPVLGAALGGGAAAAGLAVAVGP